MGRGVRFAVLCGGLAAGGIAGAAEVDVSGYVSAEPRFFFSAPAFAGQDDRAMIDSFVAAPELRYAWHDGTDRITIAPFVRGDAADGERAHADLRELNWLRQGDAWTFRIGIGKVFWGVAESRHLVDVVNQTDLVEDIDEEDKLGQPMAHVERYTEHGTFALLLLPGFRERTFPADDARLRGALPIARDSVVYEPGAGSHRTDVAVRWSHSLGAWDLGVSAFRGTGREPRLVPGAREDGRIELVPHYDFVRQVGVDVQYTRDAWLWKLESLRRSGQGGTFDALAAGFEYTLFDIRRSGADLGVLAEYLYDGRDEAAPAAELDDDIFVGMRLALNDVNDTMALFGVVSDRGGAGTIGFVEGQRRLWDRWRLELELRWLRDAKSKALLAVREDSFLTVRLARFF